MDLEVFADHSHLGDAVASEPCVSETSVSDEETSCTEEDIEPQDDQEPDLCNPSSSQAQLTCRTELVEEEPNSCKPSSSQAQLICTTEPLEEENEAWDSMSEVSDSPDVGDVLYIEHRSTQKLNRTVRSTTFVHVPLKF